MLQSLFVRIVQKRRTLARAHYLEAYLYRMARNEAATYAKGRRRATKDGADAESWLTIRGTGDQPYDLAEQLHLMLSRLPQAQREVVVLKVYREKTFQEIARLLDVSVNTVASRYRYGMEKLRNLLKDNVP